MGCHEFTGRLETLTSPGIAARGSNKLGWERGVDGNMATTPGFLDFPPVTLSMGGVVGLWDRVRGVTMNEITAWIQSNWYELGGLFVQCTFLLAGVWFARKILKTMRASQEQVGALLRLSVTDASPERPRSSATPYWVTPS